MNAKDEKKVHEVTNLKWSKFDDRQDDIRGRN